VAKTRKAKPATKKASAKKTRRQKPKSVAKRPPSKSVTRSNLSPAPAFSVRLKDAALKILNDRQAQDVVIFNLMNKSSVADYLIVASGRAARQIAAMAQYLRSEFAKLGVNKIRVEGLPEANWVLVDGGDVIIHLFRPEVRRYYNIESIWNNEGGERSSSFIE
jgi:ribosome-associated protein